MWEEWVIPLCISKSIARKYKTLHVQCGRSGLFPFVSQNLQLESIKPYMQCGRSGLFPFVHVSKIYIYTCRIGLFQLRSSLSTIFQLLHTLYITTRLNGGKRRMGVGNMMFKATFNNISVLSRWSVLLVEETRVPGENYRSRQSLTNLIT